MRLTVFAATLAFLLWGTPAFAGTGPDFDADGITDDMDNCSDAINTGQDDTDDDDCGNICDADYNGSGAVDFTDFGQFSLAYGGSDEAKCHIEPIPGCSVGFPDFGAFSLLYGTVPGPSGTTAGTTACP
jgi:hypothetical protein